MNIRTKQDRIDSVAYRFEDQYHQRLDDTNIFSALTRRTQIFLLREATTEDEIEAIIGNRTWTRNECDECERDCDILVETQGYYFCLSCLKEAIQLIQDKRK